MQLLEWAIYKRGVDVRAATALEVCRLGGTPDNGDVLRVFQRQEAVVLEQNHPLGGDPARQGVVGVDVKAPTLGGLGCLEDDFQDAAHRLV